ncbi:MAG: aspartyl-tRNA(Asn)/glutamyl-tRNA(Gln) amidotransferase subunit B [Flavobacteriales bacterium]
MSTIYDKYETVIGLEVHAQLMTKSKAYSSDRNEYGSTPNTNVSVVTLGHPGTLPKYNKQGINFAVKMGLACESTITKEMIFARKNYFYPDLPKGYQITQDETPICTGGFIHIKDENGNARQIELTRIHLEEDAGKSIHDLDPFNSLIDLNRAGVPLIEIVSEPQIKSSQEAYDYVSEVRKLVRYLDICDGNMEEGSLRCDANVSVMLKGAKVFGNRTEVKNMNSMRNVQKAIDFEVKRQIDLLEQGEIIKMETRSFNAANGSTISMRSKEAANDYRFFPEPDLQPLQVTAEYVEKIKEVMPPLPNQLFKKYTEELNLSEYDALVLTENKEEALYFEAVIKNTSNYKSASNWVTVNIKSYLNEKAIEIDEFEVEPKKIGELIQLIDDNKISNSVASQKVFPLLIETPSKSPLSIAEANNWIQNSDEGAIEELINKALSKFPEKVEEYKSGKKGLLGLFMGEVMKLSQGKADPKLTNQKLREILDK